MVRSRFGFLATLCCFPLVALNSPRAAAGVESDEGLTFAGITLYGVIDIGVQFQTHGAPASEYFPGGSTSIVQKDGNHAVLAVTPNNLGQSRIGVRGLEPLSEKFAVVFELETFFNPQSGELSDGLKSLTLNNGRPLASQSSNADSSAAGQVFQQSYLGVRLTRWGTMTFGRQNSVLADGIVKYDPNYAALAFSLIGQSGAAAGGGYTEDRRLDSSVKYDSPTLGAMHFALLYKTLGASGSARAVAQGNVGAEVAGGSIDAYYALSRDAISASPLSRDQLTSLPILGFSSSNTLAGVVSDNEAYALMGSLPAGSSTLFVGYEHIRFANPVHALSSGIDDIGGYRLAFVNDAAYPIDKRQQIFWAGVRYPLATHLNLSFAYYGSRQNSYAGGADAGCHSTVAPSCGGTLDAWSTLADYRLSLRLDAYAGIAFTAVHQGVASGYLHSTDLDPTIGVRYAF